MAAQPDWPDTLQVEGALARPIRQAARAYAIQVLTEIVIEMDESGRKLSPGAQEMFEAFSGFLNAKVALLTRMNAIEDEQARQERSG